MKTMDEINLQHLQDRPRYTGKSIVMLDKSAPTSSILNQAAQTASLELATFSDYDNDLQKYHLAFEQADGIVFEKFGVAVIKENKTQQVNRLMEVSGNFLYSEPERYVYAIEDDFKTFIEGYKSAVDHLYQQQIAKQNNRITLTATPNYLDDNQATWGMHAVNALNSRYTGKGINIAVLDTGLNLNHPDFLGRNIRSESFITGLAVDDLNGHGSHCTGILAGNVNQNTHQRYGVAKDANIFIGKVMSNSGQGSDGQILAGLEWAMLNKCQVVSMSLGSRVDPGETYSQIFNTVANRALEQNTLIIAAAGNASKRMVGHVAPVTHPANCPGIMAVAALDNYLNVAQFSCGGVNTDGGQIDIAAPGVDIYSSFRSPYNYVKLQGTSMAAPFVAGIVALYWEANPQATAPHIWMKLVQNAKRLSLNATDVGAGLVQAPL